MDFQKIAKENQICELRVGSKLYGTDNEHSDNDYVGIFIPTESMLYGLHDCEQVEIKTNKSNSGVKNTKEDTDIIIYNIKKFIHLAYKCSPNIIELFFVDKKIKL